MRQLTYKDVLDARTLDEVNQVSLVRARQQVRRAGHASFGLVMSYKAGGLAEHNLESFGQLTRFVRGRGYGQLPLRAHWTEPGAGQTSTVLALVVPGLSLADAVGILGKLDLAAIVYAGPEHAGKVALYHRDGTHTMIGRFRPGAIAMAYARAESTKLAGSGLYFEAQPACWIDAVLENARAA